MTRYFASLLCGVMSAIGWFACSSHNVAGGSSSTDNGKVLGMICREDGLPAPRTQVYLRPSDFDPCRDFYTVHVDTTDMTGDYSFSAVAPGMYVLEAVGLDSRARALVNGIIVDTSIAYAPVATLSKPGAISIILQGIVCSASCYVYVPGTSFHGMVRNGIGFIDSVPAGKIAAVRYSDLDKPSANRTIKTGFTVSSGATREIADYFEWSYSKKIVLNTTISGAGVSGNVVDFPVLLRLTSANFDFDLAHPDGRDLRFKKEDDSPLKHEIERWDPVAGRAEVWVRVDTVYGNNGTQFFMMFWGNPVAESASNSAAVFDTTAGFQGVWHLSETATETVYDATQNRYHGTAYFTVPIEGAVGIAQGFNGASSYISMANTASSTLNFPQDGEYSMSLWVYADTLDTLWRAIAGKGHEQYYMQLKGLGRNKATWEFVEFQDQRGWEYTEDTTPPAPGAKQWLYLVGVRSGTSQYLYVNGVKTVDTARLMPGAYARNTGDNFTIGRYGRSVTIPYFQGWSYFKGKIDEVRVSRGEMTADRIKLCYMNQKAGDELVVFGQ